MQTDKLKIYQREKKSKCCLCQIAWPVAIFYIRHQLQCWASLLHLCMTALEINCADEKDRVMLMMTNSDDNENYEKAFC